MNTETLFEKPYKEIHCAHIHLIRTDTSPGDYEVCSGWIVGRDPEHKRLCLRVNESAFDVDMKTKEWDIAEYEDDWDIEAVEQEWQ